MTLSVLAAFPDEADAMLAKELLAPDIQANVMGVSGANYGINISTVTEISAFRIDTWLVQVLPEDLEKAREILLQNGPEELEEYLAPMPEKEPMFECPQCHQISVIQEEISTPKLVLFIFLLGIPFFFYKPGYQCTKCAHNFRCFPNSTASHVS